MWRKQRREAGAPEVGLDSLSYQQAVWPWTSQQGMSPLGLNSFVWKKGGGAWLDLQ